MEAERQYCRPLGAFDIEHVEGKTAVVVEVGPGVEPLRRQEPHVVGVQHVVHDEVRLPANVNPSWKVVGVGAAVVLESAVLGDLFLFDFFFDVLLVDPAQTVRRDLMAGRRQRGISSGARATAKIVSSRARSYRRYGVLGRRRPCCRSRTAPRR